MSALSFGFPTPSFLPVLAFCHCGSVPFVCRHFGFIFPIPTPHHPTADVGKISKHVVKVIECRLTQIFNESQLMPRPRPPPIRDQKLTAWFTAEEERAVVYLFWWKAVKRQMERREIHWTSNPAKQQWVGLTRWSLTRVPLCDQATLYMGTSTEAVKLTAAVDLFADILKKLNHSPRDRSITTPPPAPMASQES